MQPMILYSIIIVIIIITIINILFVPWYKTKQKSCITN